MSGKATLIQCTNSKREGTHPARDLYDDSRYFRRMRAWAEAKDQPWFILSAKHGILHPDDEVSDYDARGLSDEQVGEIAAELVEMGFESVDITAGMDYTDPLVPELERRGVDVVNHFAGKRIGTREMLLEKETNRLRAWSA